MHQLRLRERKRLANEARQALAQRVVKSFHMCGFSRFFSDCLMLLVGDDRLIGRPEICIAGSLLVDLWNGAPELLARAFIPLAQGKGHNLAGLST